MKNTGKPTERLFEESITALGKAGYFYRIKDAAAIKGLTGRVGVGIDATPSDYICVVKGTTFFCEVKSTHHATLFEFKMLARGQNAHGARIIAAGGNYLVMIHRMQTDDWYLIAKRHLVDHQDRTGTKSISWAELETFKCTADATRVGRRPQW